MRLIVEPRRSGKTSTMIEMIEENKEAMLVVFSEQEADRLRMLKPELARRIVAASAIEQLHGRRFSELYVDNADMVLRAMLGPVTVATFTSEP